MSTKRKYIPAEAHRSSQQNSSQPNEGTEGDYVAPLALSKSQRYKVRVFNKNQRVKQIIRQTLESEPSLSEARQPAPTNFEFLRDTKQRELAEKLQEMQKLRQAL